MEKKEITDRCPSCGHLWEEHEFGVPSPYCPIDYNEKQEESIDKVKQVIVMRKDLNMRKGKMIAQGAHASMKVILDCMIQQDQFLCDQTWTSWKLSMWESSPMYKWLNGTFKKVVVYVSSEEKLLQIHKEALQKGIFCSLIQDKGLTEFKGIPTYTCCAIGPDFSDKIDEITKHLPLL